MSSIGMIKISEPERIQTAKDIIIEHRAKAGARASYELYAINYGSGKVRVTRIDHAPTSGDFAPMVTKSRIAWLTDNNNMVVEFRGAWKTDDQAKVVAYESQHQADINAAK
jgi:hypothetical protein